MLVCIGSTNPAKVLAVTEVVQSDLSTGTARIIAKKVSSQVAAQPMTLDAVVAGARNRAAAAYDGCDLSFGIEGGLMPCPGTHTGYLEICVCAVFNGEAHYLGLASGFEHPRRVIDLITAQNLDVSTAYHAAGLTAKTRVGEHEGAIGVLSNNSCSRKDYIKTAVYNAVLSLKNKHLLHG